VAKATLFRVLSDGLKLVSSKIRLDQSFPKCRFLHYGYAFGRNDEFVENSKGRQIGLDNFQSRQLLIHAINLL